MCAQVQAKIDDLFKKSNQMMLFYPQNDIVGHLSSKYDRMKQKPSYRN